MKVVVTAQGPDMASEVDPRFGRAQYFVVVETEDNSCTSLENSQNLNAMQGAGIQAAQQVVKLQAEAVVTGNVGPKAFQALQAADVKCYIGATGTVAQAVKQLVDGQLEWARAANVEGHWTG